MTRSNLQLALREWQQALRKPMMWLAVGGISVILALIGPFGSDGAVNLPTGFVYWAVIVLAGYSVGLLVSVYSAHAFPKMNRWALVVGRGIVIGLCMSCIVIPMNHITFGPASLPDSMAQLVVTIIIISMIVAVLFDVLEDDPDYATTLDTPSLMDRLPFDKRGALIALSVEDHYVRIYTDKGEEMVLMRLADAIRETANAAGAQVHRSYWASFSQVKRVKRDGGRTFLVMQNDLEIPVSRSNLPKIKEAGLLPR